MIYIIGIIIIILLAKYTDRFALSDSKLVLTLIGYTVLSVLLYSYSNRRNFMMDRFFNIEGMCDSKSNYPLRYKNTYQEEDYGTTGLNFDNRSYSSFDSVYKDNTIPFSEVSKIVNEQKYNLSDENNDTHSIMPYFSPVSYNTAPHLIMESKMHVLEDEQALDEPKYNSTIGKDRGYLSWQSMF